MPLNKDHYLNLKNGIFDSTTRADLDRLFQVFSAAPARQRLVLHFHGGLVNEQAGMEIATRLLPVYQKAEAYPVFFVWEAGLIEVITHNLQEIFKENIFQRLLERVTQFALAKLEQSDVTRGGLLELPSTHDVRRELQPAASGAEPFSHLDPSKLPSDESLRALEEQQFRDELEGDPALIQEIESIANALRPSDEIAAEQSATRGARVKTSTRTLMSPEVLEELRQAPPDTRGFLSTAKIVKEAVTVLARVITRFARKRDHGFYGTIVEEILREFYIANIGKFVWDQIKQDTADAFGGDENRHGGTAFLAGLRQAWDENLRPSITLVGHSTGAIYICHFLKNAHKRFPPEAVFNIIFLAPACTFDLFAETLQQFQGRISNIRVFGMSDQLEKADKLVPVIYPHSLLYFVAGLTEDEADKPLVGMQRYHSGAPPYDASAFPAIKIVTDFIGSTAHRSIWSECDAPDGCMTKSHRHGDFDNDEQTLASLCHIITKGF